MSVNNNRRSRLFAWIPEQITEEQLRDAMAEREIATSRKRKELDEIVLDVRTAAANVTARVNTTSSTNAAAPVNVTPSANDTAAAIEADKPVKRKRGRPRKTDEPVEPPKPPLIPPNQSATFQSHRYADETAEGLLESLRAAFSQSGCKDRATSCGLISGVLVRLRYFHLLCLKRYPRHSMNADMIRDDMTIKEFTHVIGAGRFADILPVKHAVEDNEYNGVALIDLPNDLRDAIGYNSLIRSDFGNLLKTLTEMRLMIQKDDENFEWPQGPVPLYDWTELPLTNYLPARRGTMTISSIEDAERYWEDFEKLATSESITVNQDDGKEREPRGVYFPRRWARLCWRRNYTLLANTATNLQMYRQLAEERFWERKSKLRNVADALGVPMWALRKHLERTPDIPSLGSLPADPRIIAQEREDRLAIRTRVGAKAVTERRKRKIWFNERVEEGLAQFPDAREEEAFLWHYLTPHRSEYFKDNIAMHNYELRTLIRNSIEKVAKSVQRRHAQEVPLENRRKGEPRCRSLSLTWS